MSSIMELHLGLALPVCSPTMKGFDLNEHKFEPDQDNDSFPKSKSAKRSFDDAFGKNNGDEASHFLVWDGHPNEEDDGKGNKKRHSRYINKSEGDKESCIVGWPPIKSSRKKELLQNNGRRVYYHHQIIENKQPLMLMAKKKIVINGYNSSSAMLINNNNNNNNSIYVKVKMEGVAIARKIDLSLHRSYHSLKNALINMFTKYDGKCTTEDSESYTLTYQDKEGDWLLAGDVPWKSFIKSVQRLEIVRNGG